MKKKTVIICIILAITVFAASMGATLFIIHQSSERTGSPYSLRSDNSPTAKAVKSDLRGCKTPEDYYNLAQKYVDDHEIFYANEIIKAGYQKTKDESLSIAIVTGKPTVETAVVSHSVSNISDSQRYYLGRETVISLPCYSPLDYVNNALIYTFSDTHQIKTIEVGSFISYDKLDRDLRNIALAGEYLPGLFNLYISTADFSFGALSVFDSGAFSDSKSEAHHHAVAPLASRFDLYYDEDDRLSRVTHGDRTITLSATATGYEVVTPQGNYTISLQNGDILKLAEVDGKYTELFGYESDGSYSLKITNGSSEDDAYSLKYNSDHTLKQLSRGSGGNCVFSYNENRTLHEISATYNDEEQTLTFYYEGFFPTNVMDLMTLVYDGDHRLVELSGDGLSTWTIAYDEQGRISKYKDSTYDDQYTLTYDDDNRLLSFRDTYDDIYNVVRDELHTVIGISDPEAEIWALEGNKLYTDIGDIDESKVYITESWDDHLSFSVRDATQKDCDRYAQSYKDAGYSVPSANKLAPTEDDNDSDAPYWFIDQENSPTKIIKIYYDKESSSYTVDIYQYEIGRLQYEFYDSYGY